MPKDLPPPELLRKLLRYDPDTGKLFWRERTPNMFSKSGGRQEAACRRWNTCFANKEAFTALKDSGYLVGPIFNKTLRSHRVAWAIFYGSWPKHEIDHINGIKSDNRIKNLRDVLGAENRKNMKMPKNNKSGIIGVCWDQSKKKWFVQVSNRKIGYFDVKQEAISAARLAYNEMGYHRNHGRRQDVG